MGGDITAAPPETPLRFLVVVSLRLPHLSLCFVCAILETLLFFINP